MTFTDGSSREIILESSSSEGFYKSEVIARNLQDHSVYIVNGKVKDSPAFGLE